MSCLCLESLSSFGRAAGSEEKGSDCDLETEGWAGVIPWVCPQKDFKRSEDLKWNIPSAQPSQGHFPAPTESPVGFL